GIAVEGELPEDRLSEPGEAARYTAVTGVDCLSVWFGNVHGQPAKEVDLDRLAALHEAARVPLVVHGGTGFPRDAVAPAVEPGVAKTNVGAALRRAADVEPVVRDLMRLYGSSGRA